MKEFMLIVVGVLSPSKKNLLLVLSIIILVIVAFVSRGYVEQAMVAILGSSDEPVEIIAEVDGIGEEKVNALVVGITGNLLVDAAGPRVEDVRGTSVYDIDPANPWDARLIIQDGLNFNFKPVTTSVGVAIQYVESLKRSMPVTYNLDTQKQSFLPIPDGYQARSFFASSFENWYAGDMYRMGLPEAERMNLENWQVVVLNPVTEEMVTIENAASPQWLNNSDDIVYIKTDIFFS